MSNNNTTEMTVRSTAGVREALFYELDALRNGTSNPARANATSKLVSTILDSVRVEIEIRRFAQRNGSKTLPDIKNLGPSISLAE